MRGDGIDAAPHVAVAEDVSLQQRFPLLFSRLTAQERAPLQVWRQRVLEALLLSVSTIGLVPMLASAGLAMQIGRRPVAVMLLVAYGFGVAMTLAGRLPYALRAASLVVLPYGMGALLLYRYGFQSSGFAWLIAAGVFAGMLFERRLLVTMLLLIAATFAV